jgi:hypothetical protein
MPKQLTAQTATITTAAVTIQALTIGAKQVTQSVFRQLPEAELIDHDGALNGEPWGVVRYHPDKCDSSPFAHRHIVWQRGDQLLRARVNHTPGFDVGGRDDDGLRRYVPQPFVSDEGDRCLTGRVYAWLVGKLKAIPLNVLAANFGSPSRYDDWRDYDLKTGFRSAAQASKTAMDAVAARLRLEHEQARKPTPGDDAWSRKLNEERKAALEAAVVADKEAFARLQEEVRGWPVQGFQETYDAFVRAAQVEAARRQRHRDVRRTLADLPQLFIAV